MLATFVNFLLKSDNHRYYSCELENIKLSRQSGVLTVESVLDYEQSHFPPRDWSRAKRTRERVRKSLAVCV